jgi:hypothetical protein
MHAPFFGLFRARATIRDPWRSDLALTGTGIRSNQTSAEVDHSGGAG